MLALRLRLRPQQRLRPPGAGGGGRLRRQPTRQAHLLPDPKASVRWWGKQAMKIRMETSSIFHNWHDILKVEEFSSRTFFKSGSWGKHLIVCPFPESLWSPKSKKHETILCAGRERKRAKEREESGVCGSSRLCDGTSGTNQHSRKCTEILYVWD